MICPYVWVIEMKCGNKWEPCAAAKLTRDHARNELLIWRENNPRDTFRIEKYHRLEKV